MASETQISAFISPATKEMVERYVEAHGVKKGYLIETALLHHLQALRQIPTDVLIPPRLVVNRASGERLEERLSNPRPPTEAMKALFEDPGSVSDADL